MAPKRWDAFLSHSSANRELAAELERDLEAAGLSVWLDDSEIRLGVLLADELRESIQNSRAFVLLWSEPASRSRWVISEILTAFHLERFIVPCKVDDTESPYFLGRSIFIDLSNRSRGDHAERLVRAIQEAPVAPNPLPPRVAAVPPEVKDIVSAIAESQQALGEFLVRSKLEAAGEIHERLDGIMRQALEGPLRVYPDLLNLAGYHYKNAYMIEHWDALQAGRPPADPVLRQSEAFFLETLLVDPNEISALNGVGSVLFLERDLAAAEFFVRRALSVAKKRGVPRYPAAEGDLEQILRHKNA